MSFKFFLACQAAEIEGFAFIRDLEFCCGIVQNHTTNGVSHHCFVLSLNHDSTFYLLWLVVLFSQKNYGGFQDFQRLDFVNIITSCKLPNHKKKYL